MDCFLIFLRELYDRYMLGYICFSRRSICNRFWLFCLRKASLTLSLVPIVLPLGLNVLFFRPKFRCEFWLIRNQRRLIYFCLSLLLYLSSVWRFLLSWIYGMNFHCQLSRCGYLVDPLKALCLILYHFLYFASAWDA